MKPGRRQRPPTGRSARPEWAPRPIGLVSGALCWLALLSALVAPAEAGVVKSIWGPTEIPAGNAACPTAERCSAFPVYERLGVDVFQYQVHWDEVAPTRPAQPRDPDDPAYEWGDLERIAAEASSHGIRLAILIQRAPRWANGNRPPVWAPSRPADFADFAYAASRRLPNVHMWMIWGEPPRAENFRPMPVNKPRGPRLYARILDAAYAALKAADRRNVVIGGMTLNGGTVMPTLFARYMKLPNGRPPRMDLWGHNPFDARFPRLSDDPIGRFRGFNDIDTLHREISAYYRQGRRTVPRLWISEWTVISGRPSSIFLNFHVSVREQARRLRAAFRIAQSTPYVAGMGWFTLLDQPAAPGSANWGLLRADGRPKPAYNAYRNVP
jgi:hypothetical protein